MDPWKLSVPAHLAETPLADFVNVFHVGEKKRNRMRTEGLVTVNGTPVPWETLLKAGDEVAFSLEPFEGLDFPPEAGKLSLLYEDDWILVFDKPAGLIVYPETKDGTGTLVNRIAELYRRRGWDLSVRYLHRLDRDTTGCFAVARNFLSHSYFSELWDHRHIARTYLALVSGNPVRKKGVVSAPIGKDRHVQNKYRVSPTGEPATTEFEVLKDYEGYALVRLRLITGKTHQIRVHMAHIGHPLLGDLTYGGTAERISRTALHSESITFPNPLAKSVRTVKSPLPPDMAALAGTPQP